MNEEKIIPFPKKEKTLTVKRSVDLFHSWDKRLVCPAIKKYKDSISYLERWYLESRHWANKDQWDHPVVQLVQKDNEFNRLLRWCCIEDIKLMEEAGKDPRYKESSLTQKRRLVIWHNKFAAFILNQETDNPE